MRKPKSTAEAEPSPSSPPAPPKPTNINAAISAIRSGDVQAVRSAVQSEIEEILSKYGLSQYQFLILHDAVDNITSFHSDTLYAAANATDSKPILLHIHSYGGRIEPAYLISKTLKRISADKFVAVVPRRAKSAATLIALGADEIHMGMMSELGPIDPQMGGLPALALGNALDVIAGLVCRFPESAPLLSKYISEQVPVRTLGYYQRVNESAVQYAERLLQGKGLGSKGTPHDTADHLVNHYKDHSFVIDFDESKDILGEMVRINTDEYKAADQIFRFLDIVEMFCRFENRKFWVIGDSSGFNWREDKEA